MTITIKRGDRLPSLPFQLKRKNDAGQMVPADMTGRTAKLIAKDLSTGEVKISSPCVFTDIAIGKGRYDWGASDTTVTGEWSLEIETTDAGGLKETFPNKRHDRLVVFEDLG